MREASWNNAILSLLDRRPNSFIRTHCETWWGWKIQRRKKKCFIIIHLMNKCIKNYTFLFWLLCSDRIFNLFLISGIFFLPCLASRFAFSPFYFEFVRLRYVAYPELVFKLSQSLWYVARERTTAKRQMTIMCIFNFFANGQNRFFHCSAGKTTFCLIKYQHKPRRNYRGWIEILQLWVVEREKKKIERANCTSWW